MTFLLDTNILSETKKRAQNAGVKEWLSGIPAEKLHLSVLTIGEIGSGITQKRERGDHRQAASFESWLDDIIAAFGSRIVPVTVEIAREWGAQSRRRPMSAADGLIAATAQVHGWTLVTRNVKDFEHTEVRLLNPFTV